MRRPAQRPDALVDLGVATLRGLLGFELGAFLVQALLGGSLLGSALSRKPSLLSGTCGFCSGLPLLALDGLDVRLAECHQSGLA